MCDFQIRGRTHGMEIVLKEKDAVDWVYRGEGAANIVLAYTGSSPAFIGKVMRIQKAPINGSQRARSPTAFTKYEYLLWGDIGNLVSCTDRDIAAQTFVQHVMSPLLGSKHVDAGKLVKVSREFLELAEKEVSSQRPSWRVNTGKIDTQRDYALILSDHSIFLHGALDGEPCISVEIKPKCGFIPFSRFISHGNAVKRCMTRFRMHQALKLHQEEISEFSDYDPLDLFSGSKDRILKAVKDLFSTPQNNFRVFLNGSLIFGALGGSAENTDVIVGEAFEDALKSDVRADIGLCTTSLLQLVTETLYKSGVLDRLLEVQKLDSLDIEGAIHAYYDVISEPCVVCGQLNEDEELHRYASLHSLPLDQSLRIVKNFLIAATAKDCSLMISFRRRVCEEWGSSNNTIRLEPGKFFDYKAHFIDLDLKPMKKMEEYYELDKKIVSLYRKIEKGKVGDISNAKFYKSKLGK
ncbi:inositol-pentakisphosphate 2-kinase-like [Cucurbita moschata]|uniref:Inositol-pentakisphosphate 2-kinase n=1 Tax=Cucurbita moschata TaxID=3662 RepID=A0A6J1GKE1_CUCMO|nr:inositol-pentakisphosphate 2-kinase-like [Cucurbita moschata]XP_022952005.1 inositol-pentakisphosphate 2-kinase-like [Cucurbita moschata]